MDSHPQNHDIGTDWSKCCLCQQVIANETTINPFSAPPNLLTKRVESGTYLTLHTNIPKFYEAGAMPIQLDPNRLNNGNGIFETLKLHEASFHKSCSIKFANTKINKVLEQQNHIEPSTESSSRRFKRQKLHTDSCILCSQPLIESDSHKFTSETVGKVRTMLEKLGDNHLLPRFSDTNDIIASQYRYHSKCDKGLRNRHRDFLNAEKVKKQAVHDKECKEAALYEIVEYLNDLKRTSTPPILVKMQDILVLYKERLELLGCEDVKGNVTRLKNDIKLAMPDIAETKNGKNVYLTFKDGIGPALVNLQKISSDEGIVYEAARILRRKMLAHETNASEVLDSNDVTVCIPPLLLQFISKLEHGSGISSDNRNCFKIDSCLSQLLQFNCFGDQSGKGSYLRHDKSRETFQAIYIGLVLYSKVRSQSKLIIDLLFEFGLCISFNRVLEITGQLADNVIHKYIDEQLICPPQLLRFMFTTTGMDNVDHNPSSTSAKTAFHGCLVSMFQHPSSPEEGVSRDIKLDFSGNSYKVSELPLTYTNVPPACIDKKKAKPPTITDITLPPMKLYNEYLKVGFDWLESVNLAHKIGGTHSVTWSAFHAKDVRQRTFEMSINSMFPLLREEAHSAATVKHCMKHIIDTTSFLNPGQTAVVGVDQPIYAVCKQVQWQYPQECGESKAFIMMGALHTEMAFHSVIGSLLDNSGWANAFSDSGVTTSGRADSFIAAQNVSRTREAHVISVCALYIQQKKAYEEECADDETTYDDWVLSCRIKRPQFLYWDTILHLEMLLLLFVDSNREADLKLYLECLVRMAPYLFANDNTHYARWLTIHISDLARLEITHPDLYPEFLKGKFVVHKSYLQHTGLPLDHANEQNIGVLKGGSGVIGLTENEAALRRCTNAMPEVIRAIHQYEALMHKKSRSKKHHEDSPTVQNRLLSNVTKLSEEIEKLGNPYGEQSDQLFSLDTKEVKGPDVVEQVKLFGQKGKDQFSEFLTRLSSEDTSSMYDPIHRNKFHMFSLTPVRARNITLLLKHECKLFHSLFIVMKNRECDLPEFFASENQSLPVSQSDPDGTIHKPDKSKLVDCLLRDVDCATEPPICDAVLVDASNIVRSSLPQKGSNFQQYADNTFCRKVQFYASNHRRVDCVVDVYLADSLKKAERLRRGTGQRRLVTPENTVPHTSSKWQQFLFNDDNKTELYQFLANVVSEKDWVSQVLITNGQDVLTSEPLDLSRISPCNHEEADTRLFVHALDIVLKGGTSLLIIGNDTDIVVIAIYVFAELQSHGLVSLWVQFGKGKTLKYIPIHEVVQKISTDMALGLPFFMAFTGSDFTSGFRNYGKLSAWKTWLVCPEVTDTFKRLSQRPTNISEQDISMLEKFVCLMYYPSIPVYTVNSARLYLFTQKDRDYEHIPPSQNVLSHHIQRAAYIGGHIWGQALKPMLHLPSPESWGWTWQDEAWQVKWSSVDPLSKQCRLLKKCGCTNQCSNRCGCRKNNLQCTPLCTCKCFA